MAHELHHLENGETLWNAFVDEASPFDGKSFCNPACRDSMIRYVDALYARYYGTDEMKGAQFDMQEYTGGTSAERLEEGQRYLRDANQRMETEMDYFMSLGCRCRN